MLHLVGKLTLTTHTHQTAADGRTGNRSATQKTPVFCADGALRQIPFVSSSSIRGLFRRHAAKRVLDAIATPVRMEMYHCLTRGVGAPGIGGNAPVAQMVAGARHVFGGLFGGGSYMLHSRYSIADLIPMVGWCNHMLHPRLVSDSISVEQLRGRREDGTYWDKSLTTDLLLAPRDDVLSGKGSEYIQDYERTLTDWLKALGETSGAIADRKAALQEAKLAGKKASDVDTPEAKRIDLRNLLFLEAMLPGTPLQFNLRLNAASTDAQIGLMLLTVLDWANENKLGGASARGCGRFEAQIAMLDGEREVTPSIFNIIDHSTAYTLSDSVQRYVTAAEKAIKAITLTELEAVYPSKIAPSTGDEAKADKQAKKGAKGTPPADAGAASGEPNDE